MWENNHANPTSSHSHSSVVTSNTESAESITSVEKNLSTQVSSSVSTTSCLMQGEQQINDPTNVNRPVRNRIVPKKYDDFKMN